MSNFVVENLMKCSIFLIFYNKMDLASACVLRPLSCLVLDFEVGVRGRMNERRSRGILDRR